MDLQLTTPTSTLLNYNRLHIELSSKCTLKCPRCPRTELHPDSLNKDITLQEFQRAFTPDLLKEIEEITFCGDIGDPIYARDFLPIVEYIKKARFNVSLVVVTNGSYKSEAWWQELGMYLRANDKITFSVDGWDQASNEKYRVNSDFESIVNGARALRKVTSAQMNWSAIYFNFNEDKMPWIEDLARDLGFDTFESVLSSKFDNQYLVNGVDPLKPKGGWVTTTGRYEVRKESLNNRVPVIFHNTRSRHEWARCANWEVPLFINVDGYVFPCPWFNSGYLDNDFFTKHQDRLSIKTRTLQEVVADPLWEEMYTRFEIAPLDICQLKCKHAK